MDPEGVSLSSMNCRGLRSKQTQIDVFDYFKSLNSNITCIQDTHLTEKDIQDLKQIWNANFIIHGGVATILSNNCL